MRKLLGALLAIFTAPAAWAESPVPSTDLWHVIRSGGPVMFPLGALSVIGLMLVLVYLFTFTRRGMATARYMQTADALLRKGDYLGLLAVSNRHGECVARIMQRTLDFVTKNPKATLEQAREVAQTEGQRQAAAMNQQVTYLADIGTIAPMLGLLGTVFGMISSFTVVASDIASTRPHLLAQGVSEALIATAAGLLVGIPAMAAYAYFRGRVQSLVSELEAASTHLLAIMATHFRPGGGA